MVYSAVTQTFYNKIICYNLQVSKWRKILCNKLRSSCTIKLWQI